MLVVVCVIAVAGVLGSAEPAMEESFPLDWEDLPDGFQHDGDEGVLAVGKDHACVLLDTGDEDAVGGRVHCWGTDYKGRLTPPENDDIFTQLTVDEFHSCGLRPDGSFVCWGKGHIVGSYVGKFSAISTGPFHVCAIRANNGSIQCWGSGFNDLTSPPPGKFVQLSAGTSQTCALRPNGRVMCWGRSHKGSLDVPHVQFVQVAVGRDGSTCGVTLEGGVTCWGPWTGTRPFYERPGGTFVQVAVGDRSFCAMRATTTLDCFGTRRYAIGDGFRRNDGFLMVSPGYKGMCGVAVDGTPSLRCWGRLKKDLTNVPQGVDIYIAYEQS